MAQAPSMSKTREYIVVISAGTETYANTSVHAADEADALRERKQWAAKEPHWEGAWLTLTVNGRGIATLNPG